MDLRLKKVIVIFFVFLLSFIAIMIFSEYRNIDKLREEYPNLSEKAYEYRKDILKVWAIGLIFRFAVPILFLTTKLSQNISIKTGYKRGLIMSGFSYGIIFFGIMFLINLPLNYYSSFYLGHKYGLSNQTLLRWFELNIKGFLVNDFIIALFLWIPYYIIFKSPKTWWIHMGLLIIPIIIFMVFISPFIVDPIFNKYTSIENESLGHEISSLLKRANISDAKIYKVDKSKDTKTMNAYMTGISKSKRIVLWDTTINNLNQKEVLSITAHEIGHYVEGHIWKNIIVSSFGTLLIMYLIYLSANWILNHSYGIFGFRNIYNYASVPLFILLLNFYTFIGSPIMNQISRTMEVEADAYEIILTEDRESAISAMEKLYKQSLGIPRTSKLYKIWYHTHPTLEDRIEFYKSYPLEK